MLLRPKSDEQLSNEECVRRAAKELAKLHICDVLLATIDDLRSNLFRLSPGHGEQGMSEGSREWGCDIANGVMETLLDTAPIDYRILVIEANEGEDVIDEDTIADDVRAYVDAIMADWVKS